MSGKPWKSEPRGSQLEAFVGAFGIHTSQFNTTGELIWFACKLFDLDPVGVETAERAASMIEGIGKKERSRRARANRAIAFLWRSFRGRHLWSGRSKTRPMRRLSLLTAFSA